ncbi:hypothetical protein DPMN_010534 [Dreissena polymorpha]|uniref:Uncharacterized protein n=1 Tax=Dreissena polymorpha TaxID=45954 RepID=A0A9D4N281_DREPO|nr:hypothetical protein DPMN_010534 [Dreissena polymorpha]
MDGCRDTEYADSSDHRFQAQHIHIHKVSGRILDQGGGWIPACSHIQTIHSGGHICGTSQGKVSLMFYDKII